MLRGWFNRKAAKKEGTASPVTAQEAALPPEPMADERNAREVQERLQQRNKEQTQWAVEAVATVLQAENRPLSPDQQERLHDALAAVNRGESINAYASRLEQKTAQLWQRINDFLDGEQASLTPETGNKLSHALRDAARAKIEADAGKERSGRG